MTLRATQDVGSAARSGSPVAAGPTFCPVPDARGFKRRSGKSTRFGAGHLPLRTAVCRLLPRAVPGPAMPCFTTAEVWRLASVRHQLTHSRRGVVQ